MALEAAVSNASVWISADGQNVHDALPPAMFEHVAMQCVLLSFCTSAALDAEEHTWSTWSTRNQQLPGLACAVHMLPGSLLDLGLR
eukprot:1147699-Pelagomonas_calceolata.AAC.3